MATIKELKEQRNNLLDKMDEIKAKVNKDGFGTESRNLTEEETSEFRSLVNEVSAIDTQIEENRSLRGNKVEDRNMEEQNLVEQRSAIQSFIKNDKAGLEERAQYVNTTQDGSVLILNKSQMKFYVKWKKHLQYLNNHVNTRQLKVL